jgi:hypothetical protein
MSNLTRIQNNQITDSTIQAQAKLAAGSITGNLLASTVTFNSNITILGNLTVANSYTQLNSINTYINDPIVVFNNNYTGSLTNYDIGILVNRNLASLSNYGSVNTFLGWSESAQAFIAIATTETGTNVSSINNSGYANVVIGNLTAINSSVSGGFTAGSITNTPISGSTGYFTTAQANNFSTANAIITNGYATTLEINNFSSPNVYVSGGYLQGLANVYATTGYFTNLSTPNLVVTNESVTTLVATNFSTGNAVISGGYLQGLANVYATTGYITNFSSGNTRIASGYADNFPIGANTAATGAFTTLTNSGTLISGGNIVAASGTTSTSTTTGALVIAGSGGLGVGGNLNVGVYNTSYHKISGNILFGQGALNSATLDSIVTINENTDTPIVSNAMVHISGTSGKAAYVNIDSFGTGTTSAYLIRHARGTSAAPTAVQALDPIGGFFGRGYGATGYQFSNNPPGFGLYAGENFTDTAQGTGVTLNYIPTGATTGQIALKVDPTAGNVVITSSTGAGSSTQGALVVSGGIGVNGQSVFNANLTVNGNAIIQGNLTVNGTFEYVNSTITTHEDPILELNTGANGTALAVDNLADVGLKMHFFDTADRSAFIGRTHDTGFLEYYAVGTESGNVISGTYGTIKGGELVVANATVSSSSSTGALRVSGGVGIAGALNVAQTVNGGNATFASINSTPIGNATPSTGVFTTINATTITVPTLNATSGNITTLYAQNFSSGNIQVTGGYLSGITNFNGTTGTIANFASANAVVTGGSVDATPVGATTASTAKFTTLATSGVTTHNANVVIAVATDTTAPNIGALVINNGGLSVTGNAYVGNNLYVGAAAFNTTLTTPTIFAVDNGATYAQGSILNATNTGSADWIAYGNNYAGASNDHGWVDVGFTGDAFNDPNYSITKKNDAYLFGSGANSTVGGNLVLSTDYTGSYNDIVIGTGSFFANAEVARFHGNTSTSGTFTLKLPTNAVPAANTGAFQVWGGASITGNVYHGGATIMNGSQTAGYDTIIKGANDATLIWARPNATYDQVIIGNSATSSTAVRGAKLQINSTDSFLMPVGTNAQRPSSTGGTDVQGMLRYNTTLNGMEVYNGTAWQAFTTSFTVIADAQFSGTGSTTAFTLATAQTTASCIVSINGVVQIPTLAYSVSGTTLTFTEAPASTDVIDVRMLTTTVTVTQITSTNGYNSFSVDNNGAYVYTGTASPVLTTTFLASNGAQLNTVPNISVATTGNTAVDSFFANTYSSAEYTVTGTISGTNIKEISKILLVTDGANAYRTVYGITTTTGNTLTSWSANIYNNSATLWATPTNANMIYRIRTNYQAI